MTTLAFLLANCSDHDWSDGGWVVMMIGMLLFWALVVVAIVWLIRELNRGRQSSETSKETALEILDRRFAAGEISLEEYKERRSTLQDKRDL